MLVFTSTVFLKGFYLSIVDFFKSKSNISAANTKQSGKLNFYLSPSSEIGVL